MLTNNLDRLVIYTDGGCKGNGQANPHVYGSYTVHAYGKDGSFEVGKTARLEFLELNTNNQAEYGALLQAAIYAQQLFERMGKKYPLTFKSDSQLVVTQVAGTAKAKNAQLIEMRDRLQAALKQLGATLEKEDREEIVHFLGH